MNPQQPFAVPAWWHRYHAGDGSFNSIDDGTLAFLSANFGGLPVLLLPVDYILPPAVPPAGTHGLAIPSLVIPPAPLPEALAHQAPGQAAAEAPGVSAEELDSILGGAGSSSEAELAELSSWFQGLSPAAKRQTLASVAKSLSFGPVAEPALTAPTQPVPGPAALSVYRDAAPEPPAPKSRPSTASAAAAAPAAAPRALVDVTNVQAAGGAGAKNMKKLSSKIYVAHSQKVKPQLPADEVKALLDYQLRSSKPSRAPWFRDGSLPEAPGKRGALKPMAPQAQVASTAVGTGVFVPQAAPPRF